MDFLLLLTPHNDLGISRGRRKGEGGRGKSTKKPLRAAFLLFRKQKKNRKSA
jgi:hypothetical protein